MCVCVGPWVSKGGKDFVMGEGGVGVKVEDAG